MAPPSDPAIEARDERMRELSDMLDKMDQGAVLYCAGHPYLTNDLRDVLTENALLRASLVVAEE